MASDENAGVVRQQPLRQSPLRAAHERLGAKLVEFGGWEMPISYPAGTIAEHLACRSSAVAFDVSHLGTVRVGGRGALEVLQRAFTNDLMRIGPGRAQYTHLLDEHDASVLDDIIVWWLPDTSSDDSARDSSLSTQDQSVSTHIFDVMPNASNTGRVTGALRVIADEMGFDELRIEDTTTTRAIIAIQGPNARASIMALSPDAAQVPRFGVINATIASIECVVAGTGYTGEDGLEIAVPVAGAQMVWDEITAAEVLPAGLGARDTLRLEAGLPLHGHELGPGITPLQANLGWVVRFAKGEFRGSEALRAEQERGVARHLVGLSIEGRQPAREGSVVHDSEGAVCGGVTSGNFAPSLGHAIALAFVQPYVHVGDSVQLNVRGRMLAATVLKPPFVSRG
jgi:aminomethyltransferase